MIAISAFFLFYNGAYTKRFSFWDEVRMVLKSQFFAFLLFLLLLFAKKEATAYSRIVVLAFFSLSLPFLAYVRTNFKRLLYKRRIFRGRLLIVGVNRAGIGFLKAVKSESNLGYEVVGFVDDRFPQRRIEGIRVHRFEARVDRYLRSCRIDAICVAGTDRGAYESSRLIGSLHRQLQTIFYVPGLEGLPLAGAEIRQFLAGEMVVLEMKNNLQRPFNYLLKRLFDYTLSLCFLPFLLALFLLISAALKLTSEGPVMFVQRRVGKGGKDFGCYKFRTMFKDSEARLQKLLEEDEEARREWEQTFKLRKDPRVTPIGRILRRTSLDELPQVINVLKGEMSLVGPRPVVREELERYYREDAQYYLLIPPGITGLWQVSGRSNVDYEQRVALDSWYVRNWSLWMDLVILLKTLKVVLKGEGAY